MLGSRSRVAVLRVLLGVTIPLNTSQIAAHAHLTRPAAASVLDDFAAMGIVQTVSVGNAKVHQLEWHSAYVEQLIAPLFAAEQRIPDELESSLVEALGDFTESIVLFGSYARGEQAPGSDVDVVLVASDAPTKLALERKIDSYAKEFRTRYGASLSSIAYEVREANALWRTSPAFFESLKRDAVVVAGRGPWEWADDE